MYDCIGNIDDSVYGIYHKYTDVRLRTYIIHYFNKELKINIKLVLFKDGLFNE